MGKVKHMMRSLVKRLSPSKSSLASSPSSKSTGSDATGRDDRLAPNSTLPTPASTLHEAIPPLKPIRNSWPGTISTQVEVDETRKETNITRARSYDCNTQAELAANFAMLEFTRALPLAELSMVGRGLELTFPPLGSKGEQSRAHPHHHLDDDEGDGGEKDEDPPSRPHTPSTIASELSTIRLSFSCSQDESPIQNMLERRRQLAPTEPCQKSNSFSTSSFVCRSARRIERGNLVEEDSDNDTSSSGSLSGWGISTGGGLPSGHSHGDILVYQPSLPVGLVEQTGVMMSDDEFNALPEWSDVENDPEYNKYVQNQGDTWSVTTASSTDYDGQVTPLLAEFEVYIPTGCPPQIYLYSIRVGL